MNMKQLFPISPGPWSVTLAFDVSVQMLVMTARNEAGDRIESGLPDDLAIDIDGTSFPVRSREELRGHMEHVFGYASDPHALDTAGGQDTGVLVVAIPISVGQNAHLHATWSDEVGHGTLEILPLGSEGGGVTH